METFAEGLATRTAFELPQRILRESLDDFVLVSDDEIRAAQALMIEATRNLVEAAGAAPLAAALRLHEQLAGGHQGDEGCQDAGHRGDALAHVIGRRGHLENAAAGLDTTINGEQLKRTLAGRPASRSNGAVS